MSSVPARVWRLIDLFFFCYQRKPGLAGWELVRTALPGLGSIGEQDHWTMWAMGVVEHEFYVVEDAERPATLPAHEEVKKTFGISGPQRH